jgi:transposase
VEVVVDHSESEVFLGIDVGKDKHYAVALDRSGAKLLERELSQDEARLRSLIGGLAVHGPVLVVVDQPASIGALVVAVARDEGAQVGYLPGLAMRRLADAHPGEAKTDARDARVIAEAARSAPYALRSLQASDEQLAELGMLAGFDDDLQGQVVQVTNRLRGLMTQIHPALERVLGPELEHLGVLDLLIKHPTPDALRRAGRARIARVVAARSPRIADRIATAVVAALASRAWSCRAPTPPASSSPGWPRSSPRSAPNAAKSSNRWRGWSRITLLPRS